eukprot:204462_1
MTDTLRLDSLRVESFDYGDIMDDEDELIVIDIPTYSVNQRTSVANVDLSINTLMLKFSTLLKVEKHKNWDGTFICGLSDDYDWKKDFDSKIITHPQFDKIILQSSPNVMFWRVIKFGVRLKDWTIDKFVIEQTKKYYYLWLKKVDHFSDKNIEKKSG